MRDTGQNFLEAYDTMTMRMLQAQGVLAALEANYVVQPASKMEHVLSASAMFDALSALRELLDQAQEASKRLSV